MPDPTVKIVEPMISFSFEGEIVQARSGQSIAAALVAAGHLAHRHGRQGEAHGHFCGMGACHECLVSVNGTDGLRACMTPVSEGMSVRQQAYLVSPPQNAAPVSDASLLSEERTSLPEEAVDVLVVGAGPGGLCAALTAAQNGASVLLIDERHHAGGQYFKQRVTIDTTSPVDRQMQRGAALVERVLAAGVECRESTQVWGAFRESDQGITIGAESDGEAYLIRPSALVIATGATEKPTPVPGWTLPGVMTTGGLQTLLRSYQAHPPGPIVIGGNGPLNFQVAAELIKAGAEVSAVIESAQPTSLEGLRSTLAASISAPELIAQGLGYLWTLRKARVPVYYGYRITSVNGKHGPESVTIRNLHPAAGKESTTVEIPAKAVGLGDGFQPQAEISRLLGVEYDGAKGQTPWLTARRNDDGSNNVPGVFVVGEAGGFGGAHIAMAQGHLAGHSAARHCGHSLSGQSGDPRAKKTLQRAQENLARHRRFQNAMWQAFTAPRQPVSDITPDTIVCRCESVTAGEIQNRCNPSLDFGAIKRQTRAGMGRCQGRYCAATVHALKTSGKQIASEFEIATPQNPVKPIPGSIIAIEQGEWGGHKAIDVSERRAPRVSRTRKNSQRIPEREIDVLVIGAGVAGCSNALFLAWNGKSVAVVDRGSPNGEASGGNAGSLHVQLLSFDYGTKAEGGGGPAAKTLPLQQASANLWEELSSSLGDIEFKRTGGLMVAESEAQMRFLDEKAALERSLGIDTQIIDQSDARALVPDLADSVIGGAWCGEEGKISPLLGTPALVAAAESAGAQFYTGEAVVAIQKESVGWRVFTDKGDFRCESIVNAAGAWAREVGQLAGIPVPVKGTPLQMIVTEAARPMVNVLLAHADRHLTLKQANNGNLIIGGGWPAGLSEPHRYQRPLLNSLQGNLWVAQKVLPPAGALRVIRSWAAINVNIDGAPILGEVPGHTGFFNAVTSNGYTLGPLVGKITTDLICRGKTDWDITPFSLERFHG
ncbi:FAD-dependent oxidoreductase [Halomonas huangheensis]|uniref:FAD-dependent oxidoreductase n=2 Tax=Halomonas huangheensis TaxID=1178482 RepID=W1N2K4_9GAMM|nr:hypothetical protein AR456_00650 [Halomonas huangheensis]ERL49205.1 hypothetical protein BJB45_21445 [Halomonas huangheensis]